MLTVVFTEAAHQKYAVMSLQMTRLAGKKNQNMPLKILCATNLTWATIMQIVTIVHVNCPTWQYIDVRRCGATETTRTHTLITRTDYHNDITNTGDYNDCGSKQQWVRRGRIPNRKKRLSTGKTSQSSYTYRGHYVAEGTVGKSNREVSNCKPTSDLNDQVSV